MIAAERKTEIIKEFQRDESDTGSPQVQIAILTERIREVSEHMQLNAQDFHSRRGLLRMVSQRNKLLRYLARKDRDEYQKLIARLGLRK
jgi:small subunit ribosomal protein S15